MNLGELKEATFCPEFWYDPTTGFMHSCALGREHQGPHICGWCEEWGPTDHPIANALEEVAKDYK